jgi:hypothetical protein
MDILQYADKATSACSNSDVVSVIWDGQVIRSVHFCGGPFCTWGMEWDDVGLDAIGDMSSKRQVVSAEAHDDRFHIRAGCRSRKLQDLWRIDDLPPILGKVLLHPVEVEGAGAGTGEIDRGRASRDQL